VSKEVASGCQVDVLRTTQRESLCKYSTPGGSLLLEIGGKDILPTCRTLFSTVARQKRMQMTTITRKLVEIPCYFKPDLNKINLLVIKNTQPSN
jgi:hypothetical protein